VTHKFKHSIECSVTKAFAWQFWVDVNNKYLEGMKELEKGIPDGMNRLAQAMLAAAACTGENGSQ
jgi:hypothetical protein